MCWHVSAPEKVPTPVKVPARADTSRCRHVPTPVVLIIWTLLFANWDVLACVSTWKGADTWEGADTSRCLDVPTSLILIIWTFYLDADICWHVSAPEKVPTPGRVLTRADTSRCRHVPTRVDIPDTNHMDFFIWMLICADMWQHLKRCRHLGRCRHVRIRLGADTCWHVPTSLILIIWTFLFGCWYVLTCVSTWKSADNWEGADTSRCQHVPSHVMPIIWTWFRCWYVPTYVSTWKSADTWEGADTCQHLLTDLGADMCRHLWY